MYTAKFQIEDYLAEYLRGKWGLKDSDGNPTGIVQLPNEVYLYNTLSSLTIKKPRHAPEPSGNLEIVIPHRKEAHKNPERYNYISIDGARIFQKKVKLFFRADLHEFMDSQKHNAGETYKDACYLFVAKFEIESFDPDSLARNYSRWKDTVRDNRNKKSYTTR